MRQLRSSWAASARVGTTSHGQSGQRTHLLTPCTQLALGINPRATVRHGSQMQLGWEPAVVRAYATLRIVRVPGSRTHAANDTWGIRRPRDLPPRQCVLEYCRQVLMAVDDLPSFGGCEANEARL